MERTNQIPYELTGQAQSAYSNSGGIYMSDGSSGLGPEGVGAKVPNELGPNRADPGGRPDGDMSDRGGVGVAEKTENEKALDEMIEWERRSRELSGDSGFQEIIQEEALKVLKAKDEGEWFGTKFDKIDEEGFLIDKNGVKTRPLNEIGTEIGDVTKNALDRFDAKNSEEANKSEDNDNEEGDDGEGDDSGEGAPLESKDKDGAPIENGDGSRKNEGERKGTDSEQEGSKELDFDEELDRFLANETIQKLLKSDTPDFDQAGVDKKDPVIEEFVNFIDQEVESGRDSHGNYKLLYFARRMTGKTISYKKEDGSRDAFVPSDISRKLLFEWAVEKIISLPTITPESHYSLDLESQTELTGLKKLVRKNFSEDRDYIHEIGTLVEARENLHELRYALPSGEAYKKFLNELRTNGLHYAYNDMAGVSQALRLHERLNSRKLSKARTWFSTKDISQIDREVEDRMEKLWKAGELKKDGRKLTRWELERAIATANTFFNGTQRQAIYEGAGEVKHQGTDRTASTKNEFITRSLYPFKMAAVRYFAANKGSRWLLKRFADRRLAQEKEKGKDTTKSIFGLQDRTLIMDQMGAPDLRSHSWRLPIMHFSGVKLNVNGESMSLLEYFNAHGAIAAPELLEDTTFSPPEHKIKSTPDVEAAVLGQTLNLSALVGYGELATDLKEKVWQKRAILNPASIVAFRPEILQDVDKDGNVVKDYTEQWEEIAEHLDIAFSIWADNQFEARYKRGVSMEDLRTERDAFNNGLNSEDYRYQILEQDYMKGYFDQVREDYKGNPALGERAVQGRKELLKKIIDRGVGQAKYLSSAKLPHVYDMDDTAYVSWSTIDGKKDASIPRDEDGKPKDVVRNSEEGTRGLDDPNMFRLLLNDQANLAEKGWSPLIPMFANLAKAKNFEWAGESVEGLSGVIGLAHAQEWNEPMALAVIDMLKAYKGALWVGESLRAAGIPMSEFEKFTGERYFFDEEDIGNTLEFLSANSVIPAEGGLRSRLGQLKREMGGSEWHKRKRTIRSWLQVLLVYLPAAFVAMAAKEATTAFEEN